MNVTSTIITKIADAQSEKAAYNLEYNITDGTLERVQTTVYKVHENGQRSAVGSIIYDRGSVTVNMPFCGEMAGYITDFTGYINTIMTEVTAIAEELDEEKKS